MLGLMSFTVLAANIAVWWPGIKVFLIELLILAAWIGLVALACWLIAKE